MGCILELDLLRGCSILLIPEKNCSKLSSGGEPDVIGL
jgi:hypothetical protein